MFTGSRMIVMVPFVPTVTPLRSTAFVTEPKLPESPLTERKKVPAGTTLLGAPRNSTY